MLLKIHKAGNVRQLSSYVKDTNNALQIFKSFTFSGPNRYLFTMDIKSLCTVIANNDGLQALKYHLNLRPLQQPPTDTLVRLAELVLKLNSFEFNNKHYQQDGSVAMGTKMGPNYACLVVGYQMLRGRCLKITRETSLNSTSVNLVLSTELIM